MASELDREYLGDNWPYIEDWDEEGEDEETERHAEREGLKR